MKKTIFLFIFALMAATIFAQKLVTIHKSDQSAETYPITSIDSIRFSTNETTLHLHTINGLSELTISEIDSISTSSLPESPAEGTLDLSQTIPSEILGGTQPYTIYLPPTYNDHPDREYPILYLFHGLGQNYTSWATNGNLKAIADDAIASGICEEMIIVSPEAYASFYCNGYVAGMNYEDYFIQEFIPAIETTYRVKAAKGARSISGLSMGGYGSTYHAFRRPEMFSSCFAMSSAFTGTYPAIGPLVTERTEEELTLFPAFIMECGTEDALALMMNNTLNDILRETTLVYTFNTRPGRHDWAFWQECLPKALKLASDNFSL